MMKPILLLMMMALVWSDAAQAERVRGHTRKDGTYVMSYQRTKANDKLSDNYSSKGNFSPNTGREGTRDPYSSYNSYDDQDGSSRRSRKRSAW